MIFRQRIHPNILQNVFTNWFKTNEIQFRYKNLQQKENFVKLEDWKEIWIPDFVMKNTEDTAHTKANLDEEYSIVKLSMLNESKFTSAYSEEYLNNFYYEGSNVLISKSNTYSFTFICPYNWADYPFDTQVLTLSHRGIKCRGFRNGWLCNSTVRLE